MSSTQDDRRKSTKSVRIHEKSEEMGIPDEQMGILAEYYRDLEIGRGAKSEIGRPKSAKSAAEYYRDLVGIPDEQMGIPDEQMGIQAEIGRRAKSAAGYYRDLVGIPDEQMGIPDDEQIGISDEEKGIPDDDDEQIGIPDEEKGIPDDDEEKGIPDDDEQMGIPDEQMGIPGEYSRDLEIGRREIGRRELRRRAKSARRAPTQQIGKSEYYRDLEQIEIPAEIGRRAKSAEIGRRAKSAAGYYRDLEQIEIPAELIEIPDEQIGIPDEEKEIPDDDEQIGIPDEEIGIPDDEEKGIPDDDEQIGIPDEEKGIPDDGDFVPPEIRARGPEALKAYEEALKGGNIKNPRLLVVVLGPPRAGKTSLLRTLKGEEFDPKEESTIGVQLQQAFCEPKNKCWSEAIKDNMSYTSYMAEIIADGLKRQSYNTELNNEKDMSKYPDNQNAPSKLSESTKRYEKAESRKLEDEATMSEEGTSKLPENIEEKVINRLKKPETKKENEREMVFKILDFAGQAVYNAIHPLFLSWKAVYILVHNLENNLHSCLTPKVEHGGSKRELVDSFEMTSLENLEFWLSSITSYSNVRGNLEGKVRLPPVFIACTHADKLENTSQDAEQIVREIYRSISPRKSPSGYHVVRNGIYTVDNTLSENGKINDASAKKLMEDIEEMTKYLPQMNEDIPITWVLFEEELTNLVEKKHKKYLGIDEAMTIANKCKVNTEIEAREFLTLLNYLHDLKTIIYFEETKTVFLDVRWLVNMFAKVITVLPVEKWNGFHEFWEKLEEEGVLERDLVEHVWSDIVDEQNTVDSMLLVMEKFSLICRWKLSEQEIYLVPSMLCNSKKKEKIDELLTDEKSSTMAVRFKMAHLPLGIFPRLFVAIAEYAKKEWPKVRQPKLCPNFCRFYGVGEEGKFDLCIASDIRSIVVTVFNKNQLDDQHVTEFCQSQRKSLDSIFNDMQRKFSWMQNMEFDYGIRCPVCLESSNKCKSHKITGCTRDSCLHIVKEEELKCERPECHEDDTNLDNAIKKEAYSHWFPTTKKDDAGHSEETVHVGGGSSEISTFDLSDEQKRWLVIGISLNKVLLPTLREFVKQNMEDHYIDLKTNHNIDTQTHPGQLRNDGTWNLNYRNINNNEAIPRKENYDYKVKSAVDLAKLYLLPHMAKISDFDDTCDMSAVLGILSSVSIFSPDVQDSAKTVRQDIRNEWGHCNIARWDDATFKICFQKMDDLLKALTLSLEEEDKITKELGDWENKGVKLCMASTVDAELVKLISVEVSQLSQVAKRLEANQKEEANRVNNALQSVEQAIDDSKKEVDNLRKDVKGIDERVESLESERRNRSDERVTHITYSISASDGAHVLVAPNSNFQANYNNPSDHNYPSIHNE